MEEKDLKKELEEYLRALKLPTILKNYQAFAQDAARSGSFRLLTNSQVGEE